MPYRSIAHLPKATTDQYSEHQKEAFLKAFNNAYEEYGGDERRACRGEASRRTTRPALNAAGPECCRAHPFASVLDTSIKHRDCRG